MHGRREREAQRERGYRKRVKERGADSGDKGGPGKPQAKQKMELTGDRGQEGVAQGVSPSGGRRETRVDGRRGREERATTTREEQWRSKDGRMTTGQAAARGACSAWKRQEDEGEARRRQSCAG